MRTSTVDVTAQFVCGKYERDKSLTELFLDLTKSFYALNLAKL